MEVETGDPEVQPDDFEVETGDREIEVENDATSPFAKRIGKTLAWKDINMILKRKGKEVKLLNDVWGEVPKGEVTAIMGPSGSGKTSLLNILSGRQGSKGKITVSSEVSLDNEIIDPYDIAIRKQIAFVAQDESLEVTSTPREAILFSAKLRLPRSATNAEIKQLTEHMLEELGLADCADTFIGGGLLKGISGGQKKRSSIGVELVVKPKMVFLDEPTSGLDSFSAVQIVQVLKKVAKAGASVLFTIHQPPSEVFNSFDHLILLNKGRVMFNGAVDDVDKYFTSRNKPIPPKYNPADWIMQVAQQHTIEELEDDGFFPLYKKGDALAESSEKFAHKQKNGITLQSSLKTQVYLMFIRELQVFVRDKASTIARFAITAFISTLAGVIFLGVGATDPQVPQNLQSHFGALVAIMVNSLFGAAQPTILAFPTQRPVFLREYSTNHYSVVAYFISRFCMEAFVTALQTFVLATITYFTMQFQMTYFEWYVLLYTLQMTATAIAVFLGCATEDPKTGTELLPLLIVPQLFFAGFFVSPSLIPVWLRWCQYLCSLTYSTRIALYLEFSDCGDAQVYCDKLLESLLVKEDEIKTYWFVLLGLFVGFRGLGLYLLQSKATKFY